MAACCLPHSQKTGVSKLREGRLHSWAQPGHWSAQDPLEHQERPQKGHVTDRSYTAEREATAQHTKARNSSGRGWGAGGIDTS